MEKRGGETNILKRAGKLGQGVGVLKRRGGGLEPPHKLCAATTLWKYNQFPSL